MSCTSAACCRRHRRACRQAGSRPRNCTTAQAEEKRSPLTFRCPRPAEATSRGIPPFVHFVYALKENATFGFAQYAAVRSALAVHKPQRVFFHHSWEPSGPFWEAVRPSLALVRHHPDKVEQGEGRCLSHFAHKADWLRLRALVQHGGLYLDVDTLSLQPLPPAVRQGAEFVLAWQVPPGIPDTALPCVPTASGPAGSHGTLRGPTEADAQWQCGGTARKRALSRGLCNAVMASAPSSRFGRHWLSTYARRSHVDPRPILFFHPASRLPPPTTYLPPPTSHRPPPTADRLQVRALSERWARSAMGRALGQLCICTCTCICICIRMCICTCDLLWDEHSVSYALHMHMHMHMHTYVCLYMRSAVGRALGRLVCMPLEHASGTLTHTLTLTPTPHPHPNP